MSLNVLNICLVDVFLIQETSYFMQFSNNLIIIQNCGGNNTTIFEKNIRIVKKGRTRYLLQMRPVIFNIEPITSALYGFDFPKNYFSSLSFL